MTPEYAAPEAAEGRTRDSRHGCLCLRVLLYVVADGTPPTGAGPRTPAGLVKAILDTEPSRPSDVVGFK